jgi:hypothetical protein
MRRLAALLLIATAGWMLYQTVGNFGDFTKDSLAEIVERELDNPNFLVPLAGSVLGLAGGLVAVFGGVGGAAIAMIGGVLATGFAVYAGQPDLSGEWRIWENPVFVGIAMLLLAGLVALLGRG